MRPGDFSDTHLAPESLHGLQKRRKARSPSEPNRDTRMKKFHLPVTCSRGETSARERACLEQHRHGSHFHTSRSRCSHFGSRILRAGLMQGVVNLLSMLLGLRYLNMRLTLLGHHRLTTKGGAWHRAPHRSPAPHNRMTEPLAASSNGSLTYL